MSYLMYEGFAEIGGQWVSSCYTSSEGHARELLAAAHPRRKHRIQTKELGAPGSATFTDRGSVLVFSDGGTRPMTTTATTAKGRRRLLQFSERARSALYRFAAEDPAQLPDGGAVPEGVDHTSLIELVTGFGFDQAVADSMSDEQLAEVVRVFKSMANQPSAGQPDAQMREGQTPKAVTLKYSEAGHPDPELSAVERFAETPGMVHALSIQRKTPQQYVREFQKMREKKPELTAFEYGVL